MGLDLKRSATIFEMVMSVVTILTVVVSAYVSVSNTQARQDERLKQLEGNYRDINSGLRDINSGMRDLNNNLTDIKLQLKDKQDRVDQSK